jgi:hypothetical protein
MSVAVDGQKVGVPGLQGMHDAIGLLRDAAGDAYDQALGEIADVIADFVADTEGVMTDAADFMAYLQTRNMDSLMDRAISYWSNWAEHMASCDGESFITSADGSNPYAAPAISPTLGTTPAPLVKTIRWITKDPLVLDLDGDGLEITPLKNGVMFDADGDTVKNASAWIGANDGLLVRDLDSNGVIDSGRELFGDNTRLANGQTAAHGFAALADLDLGSVVNGVTVGAGDGVIDTRDACFAELRVWRDLNQDGVSQADELATLTEAGIEKHGVRSFVRIC